MICHFTHGCTFLNGVTCGYIIIPNQKLIMKIVNSLTNGHDSFLPIMCCRIIVLAKKLNLII